MRGKKWAGLLLVMATLLGGVSVHAEELLQEKESVSEYEIAPPCWQLDNVQIGPTFYPEKGDIIEISANASGDTESLQYKFVWQRNHWSEWGVIQPFSSDNSVTWQIPYKAGTYKLYVDVKDSLGRMLTNITEIHVQNQKWEISDVDVNGGISQQICSYIPVTTHVWGDTSNLQYKFVWQKDNWASWGVIRDFSSSNTVSWYPTEPGEYKIYSDVKDSDGILKTRIQSYTVSDVPWKVREIACSGTGTYLAGDTAQVTIHPGEGMEGFQYKVVQRYGDTWEDWKVVQDFSENRTCNVYVAKPGKYTIYVDVKDRAGNVYKPVTKVITGHSHQGVSVSSANVTVGNSTVITANVSGSPRGAEYKFVWQKDGWKEWGVIRDFSPEKSVQWTPPSEGTYGIYADVRMNGAVSTQSTFVHANYIKNGWFYEDGYKFYYENGQKLEDVRHLIGYQPNYEIHVNKQECCVTVYANDGLNGYIIPVVSFACSPGRETPTGIFYTQNKYRWHHLYGADGQFCTRIVGHVLFHSPPYSRFDNRTLWPKEYNRLGKWASAGCIRLRSGDAYWIYENCGLGTTVVIYNSSDPGPFSKPVYPKIPLWQRWDPTDPFI